jgi:hypothetical protein
MSYRSPRTITPADPSSTVRGTVKNRRAGLQIHASFCKYRERRFFEESHAKRLVIAMFVGTWPCPPKRIRDQEVAGSNPVTPTSCNIKSRRWLRMRPPTGFDVLLGGGCSDGAFQILNRIQVRYRRLNRYRYGPRMRSSWREKIDMKLDASATIRDQIDDLYRSDSRRVFASLPGRMPVPAGHCVLAAGSVADLGGGAAESGVVPAGKSRGRRSLVSPL